MYQENEELTLAYENLQEIPRVIVEKFPRMRHLDISHNNISDLGQLSNFASLKSLIVDDNPLTEDAQFPALPHLELLWMNNCKIHALGACLDRVQRSCPNLKYLCLMGNPGVPSYTIDFEGVLCENPDYRCMVVSKIPSLIYLDDMAITKEEKERALRRHSQELDGYLPDLIINKPTSWINISRKLWGQLDTVVD